MRKLLLLLLLLPIGVFGQDPVKGLFGSGTPDPNLAGVINTIYTDISSNKVYICTNVVLTPTTRSCTWTPSSISAGVTKANTISATDYGVTANAQWSRLATFTNGSGAVVLNAADPPFAAGDVGKTCFGTNYQGGTGSYNALVLRISAGTISTVTDATHATCSNNSNANCAALCTFVWGTDDTAGLTAAWNAAANNGGVCKSLILPTGGMLTTTGQFNSATCSTGDVVVGDKPMTIWGQGMRNTVIIPVGGTFVFSQSTSCNGLGGASTKSCFMGIDGLNWNNLQIHGMGWCNTSATAGTAVAYIGTDGYPANVDIDFFGCSDNNLIGYTTSFGGTISFNINNNGAGSVGLLLASGTAHDTNSSYICCNLNASVRISGATTTWNDIHSGFAGNGCGSATVDVNAASAIVNFYDTRYGTSCGGGNLTAFGIAGAGTVVNQFGGGCTALPFGSSNTCVSIASGATMYSTGGKYFASGAGAPIFAASGGKFFNGLGNVFSGTANSFASGTYLKPAPEGNCAVSSASPAACGSAGAGFVAVPTAATTYTVNTTAVTAGSQVIIQQDTATTTGTLLGVTCNTTVSTALPLITAKVAGTSFTFSLTGPTTNPACFSYTVIN
jgi:hypothetical protein